MKAASGCPVWSLLFNVEHGNQKHNSIAVVQCCYECTLTFVSPQKKKKEIAFHKPMWQHLKSYDT